MTSPADLAELSARITRAVGEVADGTVLRIVRRTKPTSAAIEIGIAAHPLDLADPTVRSAAVSLISDVAVRLACTIEAAPDVIVGIHPDYWAGRQMAGVDMKPAVSARAFLAEVRRGDVLKEIEGRDQGSEHLVVSKGPGWFSTRTARSAHDMRWKLPSAPSFVCDGAAVRICEGSERDPDAHRLLLWIRNSTKA